MPKVQGGFVKFSTNKSTTEKRETIDNMHKQLKTRLNFFSGRPIQPDTCVSSIKQCFNLNTLKSVHASMIRSHLHHNIFFSTNLITQYASLGYISHAYTVFSASQQHPSDIFRWNVMIQGFVDNTHYQSSIYLYLSMRQLGILPDYFTFPFLLKACGCLEDFSSGVKIHSHLIQLGYESDVFVGNSLIAMYGKCKRFEVSLQVFDRMPDRNVVSWSCLIGVYAQNCYRQEGMSLFLWMLDEGIRPNRSTILNVMACVRSKDEANNISSVVVNNGLDLDQSVQNAAMRMYGRLGRIDIARRFFDGIVNKDLVSWTSMIEAYAQAGLSFEALELFKHMMLQGISPDSVTLISVIRACSNLASFQQVRLVHGFIIRNIFKNQVTLETALVDLYVKCGNIKYAINFFDRMQEKNLISWSTMISGYGRHGQGREALRLFNQMKTSVKPDHITFVSVLSACSHGGFVIEGWDCFNSMVRDYRITPGQEHYTCMVDLLGRAGRLNEAHDFIGRMPIRPDAGVWGALLGACRIHSNVELAEKAAASLLYLDPENPGRYVLLSNIYASSGKIKEADQIRALMKHRGVNKTVGSTNIEY